MPHGSYIDASNLGAEELAKEMLDTMSHLPRYHDFFKWRGHYTFEDTTDGDHRESVCEFCAFLNKQIRNKSIRIYRNITRWWNTNHYFPIPDRAKKLSVEVTKTPKKEFQSILSDFFDFFLNFLTTT